MLSSPIITRNGVRQGDSLACLLFNVALEKVKDAGINTRGTIFYKSVQILAFADDIDTIGRIQESMK
jgi:sorting nexin-29